MCIGRKKNCVKNIGLQKLENEVDEIKSKLFLQLLEFPFKTTYLFDSVLIIFQDQKKQKCFWRM